MSDTNRNTRSVCKAKNIAAVVVHVRVYDVIGTKRAKQTPKVSGVAPWRRGMHARKDLGAKSKDFLIIGAPLMGMNHEIHVKALSINVAQDMHQPGLDTAPIHAANNMQYPGHMSPKLQPFSGGPSTGISIAECHAYYFRPVT
jgi:hypothetical protein